MNLKRFSLGAAALLATGSCSVSPAAAPLPVPQAPTAEADPVDRAVESIDAAALRAHVAFLSHDLLEGRAPGTRGGRLAAEYIAAQYAVAGLEPVNGSFFQTVPTLAVTADPARTRLAFAGPGGTLDPRYMDDFVSWTLTQRPLAEAEGEVVFGGYGIVAPEQSWNDYAGADVRDKIVMVLVNDPPAPAAEPALFGGRAMTYYGRWTYKLEEAERQGAAGVILVHTDESATYPWGVVTGSWTGPQYQLPLDPDRESPLPFAGWVTRDAAARILALGGHDLDRLTAAAQQRGFEAVPTGVRASSSIRSTIEGSETANVVGLLRGTGDEVITYSAHYDHLGIGTPVDGDSIYNGALDNASGVSVLLEVAEAFASLPQPPARSVLFIATAAEESGLLGAQHYVENPLFPVERTVANLNVDMTYLYGRTRDVEQLGGDRSTLGAQLDSVLAPLGMHATGDPNPERGSFFRSDHFPFAKAGIPALYFKTGVEVIGRPEGWGAEQRRIFNAERYHQPSDEMREDLDFRTAEQIAEVAFRLGHRIATAPEAPRWLPSSEFQRR